MSDYQNIGNSIIKNINLNHYISGQITLSMMQEISDFGITLIINNRPDNEEINQESSKELKIKAESLGIKFIDIPYSGNSLTKEKIITFSSLIKNNEEKSLFFCRSGARSATIWGIASVLFLDSDIIDVMSKINNIGYDSSILPNLVKYFKND
jgi:uncharacterized protein (TIGR01244 family)